MFCYFHKAVFKALSLPVAVLINENPIVIKTGPAFFYKEKHWVLITGFNFVHDTSFHFLPLKKILGKFSHPF